MARKSKRRPARRPGQSPGARPQQPSRPTQGGTGASAGGGGQATVRAVEMSLAPRGQTRRAVKGQRVVMEDADPSIPIDRVPFFLPDLRRLAIVASAMVVLLVAGEKLVPLLLK